MIIIVVYTKKKVGVARPSFCFLRKERLSCLMKMRLYILLNTSDIQLLNEFSSIIRTCDISGITGFHVSFKLEDRIIRDYPKLCVNLRCGVE